MNFWPEQKLDNLQMEGGPRDSRYFVAELLKLLLGDALSLVLAAACGCCGGTKGADEAGEKEETIPRSKTITFGAAQQEWAEAAEITTYEIADNEKYASMAAADVDLEYFVETGVLARLLKAEEKPEGEKPEGEKAEGEKAEGEKKSGEDGPKEGKATGDVPVEGSSPRIPADDVGGDSGGAALDYPGEAVEGNLAQATE